MRVEWSLVLAAMVALVLWYSLKPPRYEWSAPLPSTTVYVVHQESPKLHLESEESPSVTEGYLDSHWRMPPMNVPVPAGTLKASSERFNHRQIPVRGYSPAYSQQVLTPREGPTLPVAFVGSVDVSAPHHRVDTPWEKIGLLTPVDSNSRELLNLYREPIAPSQDLWAYQAVDRDGFVIELDQTRFLEDGDVIHHVIGKGGPWRVHNFVQNKYVWV